MPQIRRMQELVYELCSVQAAALPQIRHMHEQLHELSSTLIRSQIRKPTIASSSRNLGKYSKAHGPAHSWAARPRSHSRSRMTS